MVGPDKLVSGGCYDPMAPWVISQEVMCEEGDDSVKVSLDGSFIYTCCDSDSCNTGALLNTTEAQELFEPDCNTPAARDCVSGYVDTYGCLLRNVRITKPGEQDECARFLRPGVSCLRETCDACDAACAAAPDQEAVPPPCRSACAGNFLDGFVAPGCNSESINNDECDIFCMVEDALFDGGDCNGDGPGRARNHLLRLLARFDDDRNGMLSMEEAVEVPNMDGARFRMYDLDKDMALDWYELGLALRMARNLDDSDYAEEPIATFMQEVAINILQLVDRNLNGRADMHELNMLFDITPEQFDMIKGEGTEEEVTALQIMRTLNIVSSGLMGMDMIDQVDVKMAVMIAVGLSDYSGDKMLSLAEAKMLRFSPRMFNEIDEDKDMMISVDELYDAIKEAGKYGCMGFQSLDMQHGDIEYKAAPLRFPDGMCNILIMPEWNYEKEDVQYTPVHHAEATLRRRKKTVRPKPPTLRNREALATQTRRKAMLEVKVKNILRGKQTSPRLAKLLSPRHVTRKLLALTAPPPPSADEGPFDPMALDPDVEYPFLVSLQTPQRICGFEDFLPADYCITPPWLVWDDLSVIAGPDGLGFEQTCLSENDFMATVSLTDGPVDKITESDMKAKAFDDLADVFTALYVSPSFNFPVFVGPTGYAQFQAVAEFLYPDGVSATRDWSGIECQQDTNLDDYWWAILTTGAPPSSASASGSGSASGSSLAEGCVMGSVIQANLGSILDTSSPPASFGTWMKLFTETYLGCSDNSGSGSSSGSGPPVRRRLLSHSPPPDHPHSVPMDVSFDDMYQYCSGVLVDKQWVLTSAFCVGDHPGAVVEHDSVRIGGKNSTSGREYYIEKVLVHPGFKTVSHEMSDMRQFDVALIKLSEPVEEIHPIKMYDGKDLGYSDCHQLMVKALGFPEVGDRGAAELEWTPNHVCDEEKAEELGYMNSVQPGMLCAINDALGPDAPFLDLGGPLIAKPAELVMDVPFVLVGITSSKESESGRHFFTRVSSIRQWVLAVTGQHPMKDLTVVINTLELGNETDLKWFAGPSHTAPCPGDECKIEECDIETGMYHDEGMGALTFSIQGEADWAIEAELSSMGCGQECGEAMRQTQSMGCPPPPDPRGPPPPEEEEPACIPCNLNATWEMVTEMAKHGKSFTGGLGAKAVHTFHKHYGVWVCVRDWNVKEQLACGAKPGEIVCFRFNEKEEGTFDFYGLNEELLLVKEDQAEEAMAKELEMMATLMDH